MPICSPSSPSPALRTLQDLLGSSRHARQMFDKRPHRDDSLFCNWLKQGGWLWCH
ncbi:hypothetical protein TIFTF001_037259 [Ficus carica]|uniref:Uncharacterized protein n=1 Tax=Ficus carica TaxID=3494 RepID=A0AA88E8G3_FICCA|nr:hypothetical protein TIFTF001_037259 [Ficus carica]